MPFLFIYLIKLSVSLSVVFLFYYFILRKLTFYNHNRWYLLGYSLLCFFIPLINVSAVLESNNWENKNVVTWIPVIRGTAVTDPSTPVTGAFYAWDMVLLIIATGAGIMLFRLLAQLFSFHRLLKKAVPITTEGMHVYQVNENIIPFSFGNSIFINSGLHSEQELKEIIHHEFIHVKQRHSLDIICSELLCLINWYNPFAWLLKKAIRQNLEFIADNKVLEKGANKKEYQYLLLKVTGNNQYSIATQFNFSSLKKRIAMMNKTKSAKRQLVRLLFLLPATAVLLLAFRSKWNDQEKANPADKNVVMAGHDHNGLNYEPVMAGLNLEWNKTEEHPGLNYTMDTVPARPATAPDAPVPPVAPATIDFVEIPIPAAVVPMQPAAPAWIKLPANVQRINVTNDKVTVWLKNGTKENYDLDVPAQKDTFEKKYGRLPEPPPPPPAPSRASTSISPSVEVVEVRETRASGISRYAPGSRVEVRSLNANPLVLLDGVETTKAGLEDINPDAIKSVNVLKGKRAIARFGEKGKDGVIEVETRPIEISSDEMIITSAESAEPVKVVNAVIVNSPSIEMRNNKELVILDGKELPAERKKLTGTFNIVTISKDDAVKKYGEKGKNGVVEITTVK